MRGLESQILGLLGHRPQIPPKQGNMGSKFQKFYGSSEYSTCIEEGGLVWISRPQKSVKSEKKTFQPNSTTAVRFTTIVTMVNVARNIVTDSFASV